MRRMLACLALASVWVASPVLAWMPAGPPQEATGMLRPGGRPPGEPPPTAIIIRPAAEPRPALKYRLVPERAARVPGNAALFYHRALQMSSGNRTLLDAETKAKQPPPAPTDSTDMQVHRWVTGPIAEIPVDQARTLLDRFQTPLKEVELGATRTDCDWEFDRRTEGITLLLPEIQEMRSLSRLVALRARLAILDGHIDEATHWIETGLVMGRHVAKGPFVIQALVGIAIDFSMIKCLEDLIQVPGTPSLYWALADRPRPYIDMREPLEGERTILEREIPSLSELGEGPWGIDKARKFSDELQRKLFSFDTGKAEGGTGQRMAIAGMVAKIYPEARRALIAQGLPEAEVEAMPVVQVSSLYSYQEYRRLLDDSYKWISLPHWQSVGRVDAPNAATAEQKLTNPLLWMFSYLTPAIGASRMASLRLDRQLDALQCIEAIRLHAASHGGKLPATLDAITEAPVPLDLATGKPFLYQVDGDSAFLSAPVIPGGPTHHTYMIRYDLKLAR